MSNKFKIFATKKKFNYILIRTIEYKCKKKINYQFEFGTSVKNGNEIIVSFS